MAFVTFQVLEGLERGRIFADLETPFTIGREEDNGIQLNDERVSRFHTKVQDDGERVILTDLDSTNGTRVNGHPVQMRVLQIGDHLTIGRCLLAYGSRAEIAARYAELVGGDLYAEDDRLISGESAEEDELISNRPPGGATTPFGSEEDDELEMGELFPEGAPHLPQELRPIQSAQISDVLAYVHDRIRMVIAGAREEELGDDKSLSNMNVDWPTWQRLIDIEMDLARYLRQVADPDA